MVKFEKQQRDAADHAEVQGRVREVQDLLLEVAEVIHEVLVHLDVVIIPLTITLREQVDFFEELLNIVHEL